MTVTVNGEEIPEQAVLYELTRLVKFYSQHMSEAEIRKQMAALKKRARDQAIGAKLLMAEAERLDIRVPADDVEVRLRKMVAQAGGREAFEKLLEKQGLTEAAVRDGIERGRRVDLLVEKITGGVSQPTEEEMQAHFAQHAAEYSRPPRAQARHILVKPASDREEDKETARSRLQEIRSRVREGADFAEMAAAYSECPSGKKAGGSLGWFSRGMMVPELDAAVFSMGVGELSDVIETRLGYHILDKTGEEEGGPSSYEDARERVSDFLWHVKRGEAIAAYVEDLKQNAVIEDD